MTVGPAEGCLDDLVQFIEAYVAFESQPPPDKWANLLKRDFYPV